VRWPWESQSLPPTRDLCPNPACRCPHWTGIRLIHNSVRTPGRKPQRIEVGDLVECVQCATIYAITPDGIIPAPASHQPNVSGRAAPEYQRAPDADDGPVTAEIPEPDMED
jgi:hypothetical protein